MPTRTRTISQTNAAFVSATGLLPSFYNAAFTNGSGVLATQLHRVDTFNLSVDIAGARTDVREFGQLARIASVRTSDIVPTVSLGYYLTNGENESHLGLNTLGITGAGFTRSQLISGLLTEDPKYRERNYYMVFVKEGNDAFDPTTYPSTRADHDVLAVGNGFVTSYSISASVGEIPRADLEIQGGNINFITGRSQNLENPALNPLTAVVADTGKVSLPQPNTGDMPVDIMQYGDVSITFSNNQDAGLGAADGSLNMAGADLTTVHLQSFSLEVPLSRTAINRLGSKLPYARPLDVPINATCSVSALMSSFTSGGLASLLTGAIDGNKKDISVTFNDRVTGAPRLRYIMKRAVLDSQNFSQDLDNNETVEFQFSVQLGGASTTTQGVYASGDHTPKTGYSATNAGGGVIAGAASYDVVHSGSPVYPQFYSYV